jgi:acyl-CoA synthetase (AMP-forming)/AMP-acid ligase II/acyl carrier protein
VALLFDNASWTEYAICYLGAQLAGAVVVPMSPRFSRQEIAHIVGHAEIGLLVRPSSLAGQAPPRVHAVSPDQLEAGRPDHDVPVTAAVEDLAEIIYTSGTTASPKGVACSHANLVAHDLPPMPAGEASFLHAFPIGTNAGQECVRMPLRRRTTAVVLRTFDPERLCAVVAERRIRRLQLVPATAQLLVDSPVWRNYDLSSVDRVTLSSAAAAPRVWERLAQAFPAAELYNAYALTEGGGARTLARYDPGHPRSIGRPVGSTEVRIVDGDGLEVAVGALGEIWLRRAGIPSRQYYRDPEATAAAFAGDWLRTGDVGFVDADGDVSLVDRMKDVIITGGLNVSSLEVEAVLSEHPAVVEAAAFGVPHDVLGQDVAAAVVAREPVEARELQRHVRARLGEHKVPHRVTFVDALPRNASGKVPKRELQAELMAAAPAGARARVEPAGSVEAAVLGVWQEILGLRPGEIGVRDDFLDLGGHSLAATQIVSRLRDLFGVELPLTAVFDHPTVAELAAVVASAPAIAGPL